MRPSPAAAEPAQQVGDYELLVYVVAPGSPAASVPAMGALGLGLLALLSAGTGIAAIRSGTS